jgi:hypothetical protein
MEYCMFFNSISCLLVRHPWVQLIYAVYKVLTALVELLLAVKEFSEPRPSL